MPTRSPCSLLFSLLPRLPHAPSFASSPGSLLLTIAPSAQSSLCARARPASSLALGEGKTRPGMRTKPRNRPSSHARGGFAGKHTAGADAKDRRSCSSTGRRWRLGARPGPPSPSPLGRRVQGGSQREGRGCGRKRGEEAWERGGGAPCLSSLSCAPGTGKVATAGGAWLQGTGSWRSSPNPNPNSHQAALTPLDRRTSSSVSPDAGPLARRGVDSSKIVKEARSWGTTTRGRMRGIAVSLLLPHLGGGECINPALSCRAECINAAVAVAPPPEIRPSQRLGSCGGGRAEEGRRGGDGDGTGARSAERECVPTLLRFLRRAPVGWTGTSLAPSNPHGARAAVGLSGISIKDAGLRENERCPGFSSTRFRCYFRPRTIGFAQASISRGRASTLPSGVVRRIPSLPTIGAGVQCATVGDSVAEVSVNGAGLWTLDAREVSPAVIHPCARHCVRDVYFSCAGVYLLRFLCIGTIFEARASPPVPRLRPCHQIAALPSDFRVSLRVCTHRGWVGLAQGGRGDEDGGSVGTAITDAAMLDVQGRGGMDTGAPGFSVTLPVFSLILHDPLRLAWKPPISI
ncbi:hypothetical protein B0H13DRAFT_1862225 [Mycena leptocephala]|nr:hypothetical protein B0H13DRAFT_1862225 [Mycena leptocephala]